MIGTTTIPIGERRMCGEGSRVTCPVAYAVRSPPLYARKACENSWKVVLNRNTRYQISKPGRISAIVRNESYSERPARSAHKGALRFAPALPRAFDRSPRFGRNIADMLSRRLALVSLALWSVLAGCAGPNSRLVTVRSGHGDGPVDFAVKNATSAPINALYLAKTER